MNKTLLVSVAAIFVLLAISFVAWKSFDLFNSKRTTFTPYKATVDNKINFYSQELRTSASPRFGEDNTVSAEILLSPNINFTILSTDVMLEEAKVDNIQVSYHGPGYVEIRKPKHFARETKTGSQYVHPFEAMEKGQAINYSISDSLQDPMKGAYDEIGKEGGIVQFEVAISDIGDCKREDIEAKFGNVNSQNTLKCVSTNPEDLDGTITFILDLKSSNGETFQKKYKGEWHGHDILNDPYHTYELEEL